MQYVATVQGGGDRDIGMNGSSSPAFQFMCCFYTS